MSEESESLLIATLRKWSFDELYHSLMNRQLQPGHPMYLDINRMLDKALWTHSEYISEYHKRMDNNTHPAFSHIS